MFERVNRVRKADTMDVLEDHSLAAGIELANRVLDGPGFDFYHVMEDGDGSGNEDRDFLALGPDGPRVDLGPFGEDQSEVGQHIVNNDKNAMSLARKVLEFAAAVLELRSELHFMSLSDRSESRSEPA